MTPGPWTWALVQDPVREPLVGYRVTGADGVVVAEAFAQPYPVAVDADNAALIAASPDLLAACKALLAVVDRLPKGHSAERVTSAVIARAAIAKAEGKEMGR